MGRSPCHPCPACGVTLSHSGSWVTSQQRTALLPQHLQNSCPSCYLPLCQETCLQRVNQRALLQTALWAAVVPRTLPTLLPHSKGAKLCICRLGHTVTGDLGVLTCVLMPSPPKLVLLAPYGTWHPRRADFGRAQFASWALGHGLSPA